MKAARLTWEELYQYNDHGVEIALRAKVPGGWLVRFAKTGGANPVVIFVPDPDYGWVAEEVED
jgi:hypothetical protein